MINEIKLKKELEKLKKKHIKLIESHAPSVELHKMVVIKQKISKELYPVILERSDFNKLECQINFVKANNGWYDDDIFHKERNGINIPNEIGKKIYIHFMEGGGSGNLYFILNEENLKIVIDTLKKHKYKVEVKI